MLLNTLCASLFFNHVRIQRVCASWKPELKSQPVHRAQTREITENILCINNKPLTVKRCRNIPPVVESCCPYWPPLSSVWPLTADEYSKEATYHDSGARSVWFQHCSACLMYSACKQYLASDKRGAQQWFSASPHALHMSQGKSCALYICIFCMSAAKTPLFLDILTSNCSVGFPIYRGVTNAWESGGDCIVSAMLQWNVLLILSPWCQ